MRKELEWEEAARQVERVVEYKCKICNYRFYKTLDEAVRCAKRGFGPTYPIGCIYGDHRSKDSFPQYRSITFAVATNRIEGHSNFGSSWACRDSGYGDSLGEKTCSGNSLYLSKGFSCYLDIEAPHFKRMVEYLKTTEHQITVWNGEKPIPLEEYIANPLYVKES